MSKGLKSGIYLDLRPDREKGGRFGDHIKQRKIFHKGETSVYHLDIMKLSL